MNLDIAAADPSTSAKAATSAIGLAGVRVLDLGRYIAAPLCAAMLADQGAEVIRIEAPDGASDREVMPVGIEGRGSLYMQMNRNKKSLCLDYSVPAGRSVLDRLIATSDVVVVNLPRNALIRLGLDYDSLTRIRPDIILTTISAFAYDGADRDRVGFDGTGQALSGAMFLTGAGDRPMRAAVSYVDYATGMSAAFATAAALIERNASGLGQHVECSLMGAALTMMNPMLIEEATGARQRQPIGNRSPIAGPSDLFAARDGWVMVQVIGDAMFERWLRLVGRADLVHDPRFGSDIDRGENGEELSRIMAAWCATRTVAECLAETGAARLPACQVLTPAQALAAESADYIQSLPVDANGPELPIVTRALRTRATATASLTPAPALGQHTVQILQKLGLKQHQIEELKNKNII